jgi:hypothetical protein
MIWRSSSCFDGESVRTIDPAMDALEPLDPAVLAAYADIPSPTISAVLNGMGIRAWLSGGSATGCACQCRRRVLLAGSRCVCQPAPHASAAPARAALALTAACGG